jgi:hypothetical protein
VKAAYTDGQLAPIDDVAARLVSEDPKCARVRALGVFALMVGTLQVSRALADQGLADAVREPEVERPSANGLDRQCYGVATGFM